MHLSIRTVFLWALVVGFCLSIWFTLLLKHESRQSIHAIDLTKNTSVSSQLSPINISDLRIQGFSQIIDFRPDEETPSGAQSQDISSVAKRAGMKFLYIPVPRGDAIPKDAVEKYMKANSSLGPNEKELLYCRIGRRAVRVWSVAESQRKNGLSAEAILKLSAKAGDWTKDLATKVRHNVSARR